jgi:UDP-glucose 4-epimerase
LVQHLADRGVAVRALARAPAPWLSVPVETLDLAASGDALARALDGADTVIHLAAANQALSATAPEQALSATAAAARNVAAACTATGVSRIVHVSTVHVYGASLVPGEIITEESVPQPRSVYALSRLVAEHLLAMGEPDVVVLRLTNGVGAPVAEEISQWSLVANDLSRQAVATGALELQSDGQQYRDFVALDDVCRVLESTIDSALVPPGTYNFASGKPRMVRELAELVQDAVEALTGTLPPLRTLPPKGPPSDPYIVSADSLAALGFRCQVDLRDAVAQTVRFCLDHRSTLPLETQ